VETGHIPPFSAPLADTPIKAEVSSAPSASFLSNLQLIVAGTRTSDAREVSLLTELVLAGHRVAPYTEIWECGSQFPAGCLIVAESGAPKGTETVSKTLALLGEIANH